MPSFSPESAVPSNAELVSAAARGDQAAWNTLVARYGRLVWSVVRGFQLSAADAAAVRGDVFAGIGVAASRHSATLLDVVREAFVRGMDGSLIVGAAVALVGGAGALLLFPRVAGARRRAADTVDPGTPSGVSSGIEGRTDG